MIRQCDWLVRASPVWEAIGGHLLSPVETTHTPSHWYKRCRGPLQLGWFSLFQRAQTKSPLSLSSPDGITLNRMWVSDSGRACVWRVNLSSLLSDYYYFDCWVTLSSPEINISPLIHHSGYSFIFKGILAGIANFICAFTTLTLRHPRPTVILAPGLASALTQAALCWEFRDFKTAVQ